MSTTPQTVQNSWGDRSINHERYERALTEEMDIFDLAPGMIVVENGDEEYRVDLESGACDCPDAQYRPKTFCKHALKGALTALFSDERKTRFVARVAHYATEQGCPCEERGCAGPTSVGERGFPCPTCVVTDEWTVWEHLCG